MKPKLQFDSEAKPYWQGRRANLSDFREILIDFEAIIRHQLVASLELKFSDATGRVLPHTGVLASMAGLSPLNGLLDWIEDGLRPSFHIAEIPPRPEPPVWPYPVRLSSSVAFNGLEQPLHQALLEFKISARKSWKADLKRWEEDYAHHVVWKIEEPLVRSARESLQRWRILEACGQRNATWCYLPPGAAGGYSSESLCNILRQFLPGFSYDFERVERLLELSPVTLSISAASSTRGYIAFVFNENRAALECPAIGNALYFFASEWQSLALETKSSLMHRISSGDQRIKRFVHNPGVDVVKKVERLLSSENAA